MKTSGGSFHQCFNAQAVVDSKTQVIVAADLSDQAPDAEQLEPSLDQLDENLAAVDAVLPEGAVLTADAGYFSEQNIKTATQHGLDPYIATGRFTHSEPRAPAPRGPIPKDATPKQRMARKLKTKNGRAVYSRRKTIVEPVFGQMTTTQDARQLLLRGKQAVRVQMALPLRGPQPAQALPQRRAGLDQTQNGRRPGTPPPERIGPKPFPLLRQRLRTPTRPSPTPTTPDRRPRARYGPALLLVLC
jgi:hypothetical protein